MALEEGRGVLQAFSVRQRCWYAHPWRGWRLQPMSLLHVPAEEQRKQNVRDFTRAPSSKLRPCVRGVATRTAWSKVVNTDKICHKVICKRDTHSATPASARASAFFRVAHLKVFPSNAPHRACRRTNHRPNDLTRHIDSSIEERNPHCVLQSRKRQIRTPVGFV